MTNETTKTQRDRGERLGKFMKTHIMETAIEIALDHASDTIGMTPSEASASPKRRTVAIRALKNIDDQIAHLEALRGELYKDDQVEDIWGYKASQEEEKQVELANDVSRTGKERLADKKKYGIR